VATRPQVRWLPEGDDHLLLTAALHPDERGAVAWRALRSRFDLDRADDEQVRVLPLVLRTLAATGLDDPDLGRMSGLRRLGWMRSVIVLQRATAVVAALREAGIESLALKGTALASTAYAHTSLRPMVDADLLVRPVEVPATLEVLASLGYQVPVAADRRYLLLRHGLALGSDEGGQLDLHWMAHRALAPPGISRTVPALPWEADLPVDEWWSRARTIDLNGVDVRIPSSTDLLLHVCLHGVLGASAGRLRWVPDAAALLESSAVDWPLLVAQARRRRVTTTLGVGLWYLREGQDVTVPVEVIDELRAVPRSPRARLAEHWSTRPLPTRQRLLGDLPNTAIRYLVLTRQDPAIDAVRAVPRFLAAMWGVESRPRALVHAALGKGRGALARSG
jgi:hypothetical protein